MPFYEAKTLTTIIEKGPLQVEQLIYLAIQIAKGLDKAHSKDIVHRDIKPSNLLITDDGQVIIIDFGLVKLLKESSLTKAGDLLGTVAYMSPEQSQGAKVDQRTDICWEDPRNAGWEVDGHRPLWLQEGQAVPPQGSFPRSEMG